MSEIIPEPHSLGKERKFSVIIPVFNRPEELSELLERFPKQTYKNFEVFVVDDGSTSRSDQVVNKFKEVIEIYYLFKENGGQGFARNHGMARADGDWFIILDSDALIEPDYLEIVNQEIDKQKLDFYGGPDRDHPSFSVVQRAISYAMTSTLTTGGIRGKASNAGGLFHPRSFNMGMSRAVWERTGGFKTTRMGEDIIFSIGAQREGFKSALLPKAFIYHKRRNSFESFFRQMMFFGGARINIKRFYPDELKPVHFLPAVFTLWLLSFPLQFLFFKTLFGLSCLVLALLIIALFADSLRTTKSWQVASLAVVASFLQLTGYGIGFLREGIKYLAEPKNSVKTGEGVEYPQ